MKNICKFEIRIEFECDQLHANVRCEFTFVVFDALSCVNTHSQWCDSSRTTILRKNTHRFVFNTKQFSEQGKFVKIL